MEEPDIGEPLIYHFIGLLSTNRCLRIDEFIFFDIKLSDSAKHIGLYLYKYPSLERWFGALCAWKKFIRNTRLSSFQHGSRTYTQ